MNEMLPEDLRVLLKEAEELREVAENIVCECSELDCPFKKSGSSLPLHKTNGRLPIRDTMSDCEYVSDEEGDSAGEPLQNHVFLRTEPGRIGTAPNRRRFAPRSRARAGSVPNKLLAPQYAERFCTTMSLCLSSSA